MFHLVITSRFFIISILHTGLAAVIQTQQTVLAALGEDAPLSCQLLETKDVQQVTWQKVLEKTERNIGSYSQHYGETVNDGFKEKVQFTETGLQKNSIVIRNVTEEDAGCYLCLFNTYPDGALTAGTCLNVYELHGPFINVSRSNSPPGSVVTCSATGRPVPMVTLTVLHQNLSFSHYNTSRVSNTNGTITFTTTALLTALNSTQVECSVLVQTAALRELMVTVPGLSETSDDGLDVEPGASYIIIGLSVVAGLVLVLCVCVAALFFVPLRKQTKKRDHKEPSDINSQEHKDATKINSGVMDEEALDKLNETLMNEEEKTNGTEQRMEDNSVLEPLVVPTTVADIVCPSDLKHRCNKDQQSSEKPREKSDFENLNHEKTN